MPRPSITHFKPGFKQLGFRSPRWHINNFVTKVRSRVVSHPFYQKLRTPPWISQNKVK